MFVYIKFVSLVMVNNYTGEIKSVKIRNFQMKPFLGVSSADQSAVPQEI